MKKLVIILLIFLITGSLVFINVNNKKVIEKKKVTIPNSYLEESMFNKYKYKAYKKLKSMTLDEKIGQLFLVRYPDQNQIEVLKKYKIGGYLFFARDFKDKTKEEVIEMIKNLQENSNIPLLTAVDEEGGIVVRVSSNTNLRETKFLSPKELYNQGGFTKIKEEEIEKSKLLFDLGINLNLAPVVDITQSEDDYMYDRSIGDNSKITSEYAKVVYDATKNSGVSYTLKHFPGYGNNINTHDGESIDNRKLEELEKNDLIPFKKGIDIGYEAILISHNVITSIDDKNPASLSKKVHKLLKDLSFKGIVITDDLAMKAIAEEDENTIYKAITSGNNLLIVTDYEKSINALKKLVKEGKIKSNRVDKLAFKIIEWKYYKGLIT